MSLKKCFYSTIFIRIYPLNKAIKINLQVPIYNELFQQLSFYLNEISLTLLEEQDESRPIDSLLFGFGYLLLDKEAENDQIVLETSTTCEKFLQFLKFQKSQLKADIRNHIKYRTEIRKSTKSIALIEKLASTQAHKSIFIRCGLRQNSRIFRSKLKIDLNKTQNRQNLIVPSPLDIFNKFTTEIPKSILWFGGLNPSALPINIQEIQFKRENFTSEPLEQYRTATSTLTFTDEELDRWLTGSL